MNVQAAGPVAAVVDQIRPVIGGRIITPDDADYDEARRVFLGDVDGHPAAIVRVADANDVARVVTLARDNDIDLAVRSGGHSNAGQSTTDGGIVIDVRDLNALEIDAQTRTVWAGSGLSAAEVTTAVDAHGLSIGFGDTGSVGIAGITLGGGIGYLARKQGMTIDSLLAAEIVTADGRIRTVDAEHEPDLFWAIRGGGGNFGVVTRFKYALHELGRVYGGFIMLPATAETITGFIAAAEAAPEELSTIANVMPAPPMPFVPEESHGKLVIFGLMVHAGDVAAGEQAVAPFRALATPIVDMLRPMAYPEMYGPEDPDYRPTPVQKTMFINAIDRSDAEAMIGYLEASDAPLRAVQLRVLGGAMARVPNDATAFAHRQSRILGVVVAFHDKTPGDRARRQVWVDELSALLHDGDDGAYVNFLGDEGTERVRAAYPAATWDRLVRVKAEYDPTNLFRRNQNVAPAA
jgi:FAD/FMN-containing dehydrogenase